MNADDLDTLRAIGLSGHLDALVEGIASRGLKPAKRETYSNGVREAT
jgi:hypothetical protein